MGWSNKPQYRTEVGCPTSGGFITPTPTRTRTRLNLSEGQTVPLCASYFSLFNDTFFVVTNCPIYCMPHLAFCGHSRLASAALRAKPSWTGFLDVLGLSIKRCSLWAEVITKSLALMVQSPHLSSPLPSGNPPKNGSSLGHNSQVVNLSQCILHVMAKTRWKWWQIEARETC